MFQLKSISPEDLTTSADLLKLYVGVLNVVFGTKY